jgi:hypothetical protein
LHLVTQEKGHCNARIDVGTGFTVAPFLISPGPTLSRRSLTAHCRECHKGNGLIAHVIAVPSSTSDLDLDLQLTDFLSEVTQTMEI